MPRRSKQKLEQVLADANTFSEKADAYYQLGIFHDNNSREIEAIPNYRAALKVGLPNARAAETYAWLSSSLYKTDEPKKALDALRKSQSLTKDKDLKKFLEGLERRILRSMKK